MKNNLKLFSGFAGIGGFDSAFKRVFPKGKIVGYSEVDPHCNKCNAITTHRMLNHFISQCQVCGTKKKQWASGIYTHHFGETRNYGDTTILIPRELPDFDIYSFGWPCQDNSIAGKRKGQKENTRSGLLYRSIEILRVKKPQYFVAENVKGLFSVNEGIDINETIKLLAYLNDSLPQYEIQLQLLNTRWLLPQNRERVFFIGSLRGQPRPEIFPITESDCNNGEKLIREDKGCVAGTINTKNQSPNWSFDASSTFIEAISGHPRTGKGHGGKGILKNDKSFYSVDATNKQLVQVGSLSDKNSEAERVYDPAGIARTIKNGGEQGAKTGLYVVSTTGQGGKLQNRELDDLPPLRAKDRSDIRIVEMNVANAVTPDAYLTEGKRKRDKNGKAVLTSMYERRIRRLTPLECCKLQGFNKPSEQDKEVCWTKYAIDDKGNKIIVPETHQYKAVGNSVTVDVVELIFRKLRECIQK